MVPLLAKNAVQIKSGFTNACMTGNYECAYALGILSAAAGIEEITDYENIIDLKEKVFAKTKDYKADDEKIGQIIKILNDYETTEVFDEQMKELYSMGYSDKHL